MNGTSFYNSFSKLLILICLLFTSNGYSAGSVEELSAIIQKRVNDTTEGQTRYVIFDLFSYFETADAITKNKIFHAYNNIFKRDGGFTAILRIAVAHNERRLNALLEEYGYPAPMAYGDGHQKLPADNSYGRQYPSAEEALRAQRYIKNPLEHNEVKPAAAAYGYDRWQETADERLAREFQEEEAQRENQRLQEEAASAALIRQIEAKDRENLAYEADVRRRAEEAQRENQRLQEEDARIARQLYEEEEEQRRERLRLQEEADEAYVRQIEAEDARARAPMPPYAAPPIGIAAAPENHGINPPYAAPQRRAAPANETPEARRERLYFEAGEACKQFTQRFKRAPNKEETVNAIMTYSNIEKAEAEGVYYNLINLNSVK